MGDGGTERVDVTRFERLELKYLIDEQLARVLQAEIAPYCVADEHNPVSGKGYDIFSLYLDTPSNTFYRAKLRNEPDRLKLRARTYSPVSPVHLEVKRKCRDVIEKTRVSVEREVVERAASGLENPIVDTPSQWGYLQRFAYLMTLTGAGPILLVKYEREAYVSAVDRYARVTFDRNVFAQRVHGWDLVGQETAWHSLEADWIADGGPSPVLLELKCETLVPYWMSALIQRHNLRLQGFSKYTRGLELTEGRMRGRETRPGEPPMLA